MSVGDRYPRYRAAAVQAAPVFMDRDATAEKTCELIFAAANRGAQLVVFPEAFIPAYPWWVFLDSPLRNYHFFRELYKNAVEIPSPVLEKICQACRQAGVYAVVGINEKSQVSMGEIWNTNVLIDRRGVILGYHRKLVPTFAEKLVWSRGDGSTVRVYETELGRLGMLICGENTNPLARFALLAQGEQVHISNYTWVPFKQRYDMRHAISIRAAAHAFEGKVFNIVATSTVTPEIIDAVCGDDPWKREIMSSSDSAVSGIFGPDGKPVSEVLVDQEGIVVGEIDIEEEIEYKQMHDVVGEYNRFDVFKLIVNRQPNLPLREEGVDAAERPSWRLDEEELQAFVDRRIRFVLRESKDREVALIAGGDLPERKGGSR